MIYSSIMLMVPLRRRASGEDRTPGSVRSDNQGFTIVELMIATTVFGVIMLIAAATVVRFTNNFQRGLTQTTTQNTARSVIDTLSQSIQFAGDVPNGDLDQVGDSLGICVDSTKYSFVLGRTLGAQADRVLVEERGVGGSSCDGKATNISSPVPGGKELLGENMRLTELSLDASGYIATVEVTVAYGEDDLLCNTNVAGSCSPDAATLSTAQLQGDGIQCRPTAGSQFCAVSSLRTTVQRRL